MRLEQGWIGMGTATRKIEGGLDLHSLGRPGLRYERSMTLGSRLRLSVLVEVP